MLKIFYESADEIPDGFSELYTETDGQWTLTGVEGLKTQKDVDNVLEAKRKEVNDHKTTKDKLKAFEGLDPEEVRAALTRLPELELAAEGKIDDGKINKLVEARLAAKLTPLERQLQEAQKALDDERGVRTTLATTLERRDIGDAVRAAATAAKVVDSALEDIQLIAGTVFQRDDEGRVVHKETGLDAAAWMNEMKEKRPHWWPASEGAGAEGGRGGSGMGSNPWTAANWSATEQGKVLREKGMEYAQRMAKSAGSSVGAARPPEKK